MLCFIITLQTSNQPIQTYVSTHPGIDHVALNTIINGSSQTSALWFF